MKIIKNVTVAILTLSVLAGLLAAFAADTNSTATNTTASTTVKPKPDKLTTCPVSGDKLGEMGKPFVFIYKDREVKLCCKNCKKDFDKDPDKYIKKIAEADKAATK
jgi:YHS domain-containing protein